MSLINDALKRARDSQQKSPPSGVTPLMPAELPPGNTSGFNWILVAAVFLLMIVACFFISLAMAKRTMEKTAAVPVAIAPAVTVPEMVAPEAPAVPLVETKPVKPAVATVPPLPAKTSTVVSVVVAPVKVQGIMYGSSQPWAIVNGKTVYVGDRVEDFQVKAISKNTVTLTGSDGTDEVLQLGE
ncbi:MAG TPA: hypothetical protein VMB22_03425 [Verrucomicrobiae bacterium]|nr:hypothetical protein [Verrucomicrobiae bacterium]